MTKMTGLSPQQLQRLQEIADSSRRRTQELGSAPKPPKARSRKRRYPGRVSQWPRLPRR